MKRLIQMVSLVAVTWMINNPVHAALINFTGQIDYQNEVEVFGFTLLSDATNVRVWTDSFQNGANFDPITAFWAADGALLAQNDDNASINPDTQTYWDSGFAFPTLAAGDYFFSVAAFSNFAAGTNLSDGFQYDNDAPIPIDQWWQNAPGNWSVWFDGVDSVRPPDPDVVPVPATLALFGLGLAGLGWSRRKKA